MYSGRETVGSNAEVRSQNAEVKSNFAVVFTVAKAFRGSQAAYEDGTVHWLRS